MVHTQALERTFAANEGNADGDHAAQLVELGAEFERLRSITPDSEPDEKKRMVAAARLSAIQTQIARLTHMQ